MHLKNQNIMAAFLAAPLVFAATEASAGVLRAKAVPTTTNLVGIDDQNAVYGNTSSGGHSSGFMQSPGAVPVAITAPGIGNPVTATYVSAATGSGTLVGTYDDFDGAHTTTHGFIKAGTTWTTVDVPGAVSTTPIGISADARWVVGSYIVPGHTLGFILDTSNGTFTQLDVTGLGNYVGPTPQQVGNDGTVIGNYYDADRSLNLTFTAPAATGVATTFAPVAGATCAAQGISPNGGTIVGYCYNPRVHGVIVQGGAATLYDVPGAAFTTLAAVNAAGDVAGSTDTGTGTKGFVSRLGGVQTAGIRNEMSVFLTALNAKANAVGRYISGKGLSIGLYLHH